MINIVVSFLTVIGASFLCAMAEAAILSLPLVRARIMVEERRINAKDVLFLKEHISTAVSVVVIINNSINIIGSIYVGQEITRIFGDAWLGTASAAMTFMIIVFGEMIPKAIGERYKVTLSLFFAKPLRILVWFFRPVVEVLMLFARPWTKGYSYQRVTESIS
jgi:CBS domain containing-hemolysin-like protein